MARNNVSRKRYLSSAAVLTTALLLITGCSSSLNTGGGSTAAASKCGNVNLAMSDWVGYTADAAVYTYVAQTRLGCTIKQLPLAEQVGWQGLGDGTVDAIIENWGHEDLAKKYITDQKVAVDAGLTGNIGKIGWFVPPWLAKAHPDILDWKNLNKYAENFKTPESGGQGQFLDGDPSFVTNDAALMTNLKLNFKVVYSGSEAALIQAFRSAETNKTWMIGYFYSPQWFLSEVPLKNVKLPAYTAGCDAVAAAVACDYPTDPLNKIMSVKLEKNNKPAANLLKNFHWTNDDQNLVAKYITADKMTPAAAAKKWVDANKSKVDAWLK
ncbi:ABC transporter substrate-binding protein [Rathayibacter soli]|uniref:ABC transporter substrate-binding protein n=1 Tax=Rathayibacter soli TaxID=3144168 RepID=UPI0027E4BA62|nr:ABC transporter substrate-binding protein [Glaciibacter superstes]